MGKVEMGCEKQSQSASAFSPRPRLTMDTWGRAHPAEGVPFGGAEGCPLCAAAVTDPPAPARERLRLCAFITSTQGFRLLQNWPQAP